MTSLILGYGNTGKSVEKYLKKVTKNTIYSMILLLTITLFMILNIKILNK